MSCYYTDCIDFYTDFSTCTNYSMNATTASLPCLCKAAVIADYTKCYPCMVSISGTTSTPSVQAYTNACNGKSTGNPYDPILPTMYSTSGFNFQPTGSNTPNNPNNSTNNSSSTKSNTGLYIGIGCGAVALVAIVAALLFVFRSRRNKRQDAKLSAAAAAGGVQPSHQPPPMQPIPVQNHFVQPGQQQQQQPVFGQQQPVFGQQQPVYGQQQHHQQPVYGQQQQQYQQPVYGQQQQQQQYPQQFVSPQPPTSGYYVPTSGYADPAQQQQQLYPSVVTPPTQTQPTPSPTFVPAPVPTADPYQQYQYQQQHQQQQQQQQQQGGIATAGGYAQEPVATTGDYHAPPPMPMPGQSHPYSSPPPAAAAPSPVTTVMSDSLANNTTVYEGSPAATTANVNVSKPQVSQHGPQYYAKEDSIAQPARPSNPQYITSDNTYHQ